MYLYIALRILNSATAVSKMVQCTLHLTIVGSPRAIQLSLKLLSYMMVISIDISWRFAREYWCDLYLVRSENVKSARAFPVSADAEATPAFLKQTSVSRFNFILIKVAVVCRICISVYLNKSSSCL